MGHLDELGALKDEACNWQKVRLDTGAATVFPQGQPGILRLSAPGKGYKTASGEVCRGLG